MSKVFPHSKESIESLKREVGPLADKLEAKFEKAFQMALKQVLDTHKRQERKIRGQRSRDQVVKEFEKQFLEFKKQFAKAK